MSASAAIYLEATKEKFSVDALVKEITAPGVVYSVAPQNTMTIARHLARIGVIKTAPEKWQDYFLAPVHGDKGS